MRAPVVACIVLGVALGCGADRTRASGSGGPIASAALEPDACGPTRADRARVPALLEQGRIHRAIEVIRSANARCAAEAHVTWAAEISTLAELGDWPAVRALADRIDGAADAPADAKSAATAAREKAVTLDVSFEDSDDAKAAMRDAYRRAAAKDAANDREGAYALYLEAWTLWRPNGQALVQAGLDALALDRRADAQRLFDRGIAEVERASGATAAVDVPTFEGDIWSLAWSPRGRIAVAHGSTISLYAQGTLREVVRLEGHAKRVSRVMFTSDGSRLVSASEDATLRVWDAATGRVIQTLSGHVGKVTAAALSSDDARIASGADDGEVRVWDAATGGVVAELRAPSGVDAIAISPGGETVATVNANAARVWDVTTRREKHSFPHSIGFVAFSPDGKLLARGSTENEVVLTDVATGRLVRTLGGLDAFPDGGVFSPDGKTFAAGDGDGSVHRWDVASGRASNAERLQDAYISPVAWSGDGRFLAASGGIRRVYVLDASTGAVVRRLEDPLDAETPLQISADASAVACGAADGSIAVWDAATGREQGRLPADDGRGSRMSFAAHVLTAATSADKLGVWDGTRAQTPIEIDTREMTHEVAISPDGHVVAAATSDKQVRLFDVASSSQLATFSGHTQYVTALAFSPDGERVASSAYDETIRVWDRSGKELHVLPAHGSPALAFSPDGTRVASGSFGKDRRVTLWTPATGETRHFEGHRDGVCAVALSPTSQLLASGSVDGEIRVWELSAQSPPRVLRRFVATPSNPWPFDLAFLPNGDLVASGYPTSGATIWRSSEDDPVATVRALRGIDAAIVRTRDGFIGFLGSDAAKGRDTPICRVGAASFPFAACAERFEVDRLLARVVAHDGTYATP